MEKTEIFELSGELFYIALIFGLLVLPKFLQRFRIPSAITSLILGVIFALRFPELRTNETIHLLSTFGISSLFLFAGLDLDLSELRQGARFIIQHLVTRLVSLALLAVLIQSIFSLELRPAALLALALLTPSTGFILDSLSSFRVNAEETFWIKSQAIAGELLALGILFLVLQTSSAQQFLVSSTAIAAMVLLLPFLFKWFFSWIAPYAPKSDFAFLLIVGLLCAYTTRQLGVYYLTGAFIAGVAARRFQDKAPSIVSKEMMYAVELFASFFVPFYFFSAGTGIDSSALVWEALAVGVGFIAIVLPSRFIALGFHRRISLKETWKEGAAVRIALLPTLVFTLVIGHILVEKFLLPSYLFGALTIYAIANTIIPGFLLQAPPIEFGAVTQPTTEAQQKN